MEFHSQKCAALLIMSAMLLGTGFAQGGAPDMSAKAASSATLAVNKAFAATRDLAGKQETEDAMRGLIATMADRLIKDAKGNVVWDGPSRDFVKGEAPASVNPSLWQSAKLTAQHGLFKLADGVYQVRGYDPTNMTLIAGKTGWIVIDPMMSAETAKAAMGLADQHLGKKPITAVIYTHSHVDHFAGARSVIDEADLKSGKVRVIAPEGFMEHTIAENVLAGNAMNRRLMYQLGTPVPVGEKGPIGLGVASAASIGTVGLIPPTELITKTGQELMVDGVRIVFLMAPGTEAPAEMLFYFPDLKVLCLAEIANKTMHNLYTLRGAKARDALAWSKYVNELLDLFPDAEVAFGSHTWPTWGKDRIRKLIANQRDMYRFLHDEALRLANHGKKMDDIGNADFYPKGLQDDWSTRPYYGSLSHNLRAVYNFYLGFYDGNPATLHRYSPAETARRYVAALGGAKLVLKQGRKAFAAGDYRWTVELVNQVVMANPKNAQARALQADALEQIAYQSENGVWRNAYLSGAQELREGVKTPRFSTMGSDVQQAMTPEMIFDMLAVRLNHQKVDGLNLGINIAFTDSGENFALELSNAVLNNTRGRVLKNPDATLSIGRAALFKMLLAKVPLPDLVKAGEAKLEGETKALDAILGNLDTFNPAFNIVTP